MKRTIHILSLALSLAATVGACAQVPGIMSYQGHYSGSGGNYSGTGYFKFALIDGNDTTTLWSNDDTVGSEPTSSVPATLDRGLFTVLLGDESLQNMSTIPPEVFSHADVFLRVWFAEDQNDPFVQWEDTRITSVGYAMMSANVADGAITSEKLARLIHLGVGEQNGGSLTVHSQSSEAVRLSGSGRSVILYGEDGDEEARLQSGGGGKLTLKGPDRADLSVAHTILAELDATSSGGGRLNLRGADEQLATVLESDSNGGRITVYGGSSTRDTIRLIGAQGSSTGGRLEMTQADGQETVVLDAQGGNDGGFLVLRKGDGTPTITLDSNHSGGNSRIITDVLEIKGGSDLSEQFDVNADRNPLEPGLIVCIDPDHPGELRLSTQAFDPMVAGVISGAGGVKPGLLMGQGGTLADGQHAVALTGRVYCQVDATLGPVRPGDLITTSDTPGHGMRVANHAQAQGAIIGKAMTGLDEGKGLVLVLVSLQ